MLNKKKLFGLTAAAFFILGGTAFGQSYTLEDGYTGISSLNELMGALNGSAPDYTFKHGQFEVAGTSTTIVINLGTLTIDGSGHTDLLISGDKIGGSMFGLNVSGNFEINSGNLTARGGDDNSAKGVLVNGNFTQNGGVVTFQGGKADNSWAGRVLRDYALNSGQLVAKGGEGDGVGLGSNGLMVEGQFHQYGNATSIVVAGSDGNEAAGLYVGNTFTQHDAGSLSVTGGSGEFSHGMHVLEGFTQAGNGTIDVRGGYKGDDANTNSGSGIVVGDVSGFERTTDSFFVGNTIIFESTQTANFIQSGNGSLFAVGGGDVSATGVLVTGDFIQQGNGNVEARANASATHGIYTIGNFIMNGNGTVTANGGPSPSGAGIMARGDLIINGGKLTATGFYDDSHGIKAANMTITGGEVIAHGGNSFLSQGIMLEGYVLNSSGTAYLIDNYSGNIAMTGGKIHTTGGYYNGTTYWNAGISAIGNMQQDGGVIESYGGKGIDSLSNVMGITAGLVLQGEYQQNGTSSFLAQGGVEGANADTEQFKSAYGAYIWGNTNQSGAGSIVAKGGYGTNNIGLLTGGLTQYKNYAEWAANPYNATTNPNGVKLALNEYGYIEAIAGYGDGTHGIVVNGIAGNVRPEMLNQFVVDGTVRFGSNNKNNYSIEVGYVDSLSNHYGDVTIGSNAVLKPIVDISGKGATGIIYSHGTMTIADGATIKPEVNNTLYLGVGQSMQNFDTFLATASTPIGGTATFNGEKGSINQFFDYEIILTNNNQYQIKVTRTGLATDALAASNVRIGENTSNLLNGITGGLLGNINDIIPTLNETQLATLNAISDMYSELENFDTDYAGMAAYANTMQLGLTNHAATRLPIFSMQQLDVVQMAMNREILTAQKMPYWQVWAKGVYYNASNVKADTNEFVSGKDEFSGVVIGAARDFRYVTFAGQAHYLTGKVKAKDIYKADSDTFGFIVGARIHDVVNPKAVFNPWFDINFAYSHNKYDQKRSVFTPNEFLGTATADVKSDLFRIGLAMGNTFRVGDMVTVSPQIGLEYTSISQKGYTENGSMGLRVGKESFESLRPVIGAEVDVALSEVISASFRAFYRYETMDTRIKLDNSFRDLPMVAFTTAGEKLGRSSGNLGAGLNVNFTETVSLGVNYDLWLRDNYTAHQFGVELRTSF